MHYQAKAPKESEYQLCWEPTLEDASALLGALEQVFGRQMYAVPAAILNFLKELRGQVEEVEDDLQDAVKRYEQQEEATATRAVNEEQFQDAVAFLAQVWKGEKEATLAQVAAAR